MTSTRQAPKGSVGTFCWHVHHDQLMEVLTEPLKNRIAYIKSAKPEHEQALRLKLIKPVRGELPPTLDTAAYVKARAAYDKAWVARDKPLATLDTAGAAYDKAWAAYDKAEVARDKAQAAYAKAQAAYAKAVEDNMPTLLSLHAKECPNCPWDGRTIFPKVPA